VQPVNFSTFPRALSGVGEIRAGSNTGVSPAGVIEDSKEKMSNAWPGRCLKKRIPEATFG